MKVHRLRLVLVLLSLLLIAEKHAGTLLRAAAIPDEDVKVTHFEQMHYSPLVRIAAPTGGLVVIRVSLSTSGTVISATPLSERKGLIDECIKNAMKWEFDPGRASEAIIVYRFEISGLCYDCQSSSAFHPPNLMVITSGQPIVMP